MQAPKPLDSNPVVDELLAPLAVFWAGRSDEIVEVSVNGPGEVWVQHKRDGYQRRTAKALTLQWAWDLCVAMANVAGRPFSERKPMLGIQLPGGHRFQALLGPNVLSGMAISVRIRRREKIGLDDFGFATKAPLPGLGVHHVERRAVLPGDRPIGIADLVACLKIGGSAFVSGATGSGKTSFMRAILRELPLSNRVITIEDVEELDLPHENVVRILVSRQGTGTDIEYPDVIDACMRFNPDTVIPGELSVHNAEAVFRLLNTGHGSFITSIHSNSCLDALLAFARNIEMRTGRKADAALPFIANTIDCFVHLAHRQIVEAGRGADLPWRRLLADAGAQA